MADLRILVTGSRDWPEDKFEQIDDDICDVFGYSKWWEIYDHVVVIHGACPTGADQAASRAINRLKNFPDQFINDDMNAQEFFVEEAYPADWDTFGKPAGPMRNKRMVDLGADVCLAYPIGESKGTRGCIKLATEAKITTHTHEG